MYFQQFEKNILQLPLKAAYERDDLRTEEFLMLKEDNIEVFWAPFEYINKEAKVIIIGITPGWTQMELAFNYVRHHIHEEEWEQMLCNAKKNASFGGTTMRKNLYDMLDGIGLHHALNINSCEQLFGDQHHLLHTTSVMRYPVFVDGQNYTGSKPKMLKTKAFLNMMNEVLVPEINSLPNAIIIPTGKAVSDVLRYLVEENKIHNQTILFDFPHPSGANGHRKKQYEANKENFKAQLAQSNI
ncbi:uracil-DNA glycosylase family protein [Neobacillus sp. Marseille-QA0830]